jgi:hypothetical protein
MSVTLVGTCRISHVANNNDLHNIISFTQTTKEAIQFIKCISGLLVIPEKYNLSCFRTGILEQKPIDTSRFKQHFDNSNTVIVEICSTRVFKIDDYILHHLSVDDRYPGYTSSTTEYIKNNFSMYRQSDSEIESDIKEIASLVGKKQLVIVSHYNSKLNGEYLKSRNDLITLLRHICLKHDIVFIDPTIILSKYEQHTVMSEDLGHYTSFGSATLTNYINNLIHNTRVHHP